MNKVTLLGRITKDLELKTTQSGTPVLSFTLAVNKKVKAGEEKKAEFINLQAWEKTAELISKYCSKGNQIAVVGRIQTRTWDDKENKKHYATEVIVEEFFFCESKKSGGEPTQSSTSGGEGFYPADDDELPF